MVAILYQTLRLHCEGVASQTSNIHTYIIKLFLTTEANHNITQVKTALKKVGGQSLEVNNVA